MSQSKDNDDKSKINPLYTIFEKHMYDVENAEESESNFVENVVQEYIEFLVQKQIAVPNKWRPQIEEELRDQVRKMMLKKTYGCLSVDEFIRSQSRTKKDKRQKRKQVQKKYSKLFG